MTTTDPASLPCEMTIVRAGGAAVESPDGIASAPFWIEPLLASKKNGEPTAMRATLGPGVVSHWHTHPLGQILFVLSGIGRAQRAGGPIMKVGAGDCVWFAPGERHWHGAAPGSVFSYVSIQAVDDGTAVHWLGPVASEVPVR